MSSQLNVDTIVDKAGSGGTNVKVANTSTYVSDGGAVTQNTVQGLAKMWAGTDGSGTPAVQDSLNNASVTDNGTGNYTFTFTNNMNNDDYSSLSGGERGSEGQAAISGHVDKTTSTHKHLSKDDPGNSVDMFEGSYLVHGDLA